MEEAVLRNRPDLDRSPLERTKDMMNQALPDALVVNYEALETGLDLPDPDDRHVLAAAIKSQAEVIVTHNLKDFPESILASYNLKALHPDSFIYAMLEEDIPSVLAAMRVHRANLFYPPFSPEEYLLTLEKQGLTRTVEVVRRFEGLI